jgi:hypothetical protein
MTSEVIVQEDGIGVIDVSKWDYIGSQVYTTFCRF